LGSLKSRGGKRFWNRCFFFFAAGAEKIQEPEMDEGEDIEILKVPMREVPSKIEKKEINHGMVLLAFHTYWMKQGIDK